MKTMTLRSIVLAGALALSAPVFAQPAVFDKYVALGDSLTAGVESNCLVQRNQVNSFPAVLARTFRISGFEQPLVQEIALTNPLVGTPCLGPLFTPPASFSVIPVSQMGPPLNTLLPRPYDNLGIPFARVADLTELTQGNPEGSDVEKSAALVLRNVPGSPFDGSSAVDQANILLSTGGVLKLVTLWIGNNDVLGAATSGVVVDGVTLTSVADFEASYQAILDGLQGSSYTVQANILDVTAIPFATTIPPVLVDPATRQPVMIDGHLVPLLGEGDAAYPCEPVAPDSGCPLPAGTLVTLPASSLLAQRIGIPVAAGGTGLPLPHGRIDATGLHSGVTLYPDEVALLIERTSQFNDVIRTAVGFGTLVDINSAFNDVWANGYHIGGITLTASFLTGGIFSYDGVHPSTIGYAIIADEFVKAMTTPDARYPRPDLFGALFTPNVPAPAGAAARDGGPWGYTFEIWQQLLAQTLPKSMNVTLPSLSPREGGRGTRTVSRGDGD